MTSRRVLLLLLLLFSLDAAVPCEPLARGPFEAKEQESARAEARRAEPPRRLRVRPVVDATLSTHRPRPAFHPDRRASRLHAVTRLARADTSSPPASPED